ncbi:MAG: putative toxin-antitoxin system toxin component, PIN family [Chloroflexi bacterium]|nr:putative toxin-antitoxin system toxin component, PIN family [Chloroflexota bacterium]
MLRVVIDTCSLVSYVLTRGDLMRRVIAAWRAEQFVVLSSAETRAELAAVLARPKIKRLAVAPLDDLVKGIEFFTMRVRGELNLLGVCRDPKDDKFLACAVEGDAQHLISSDRDLLEMKRYQDVTILNPGQFLLALELYSLEAEEITRRFDRDTLIGILETVPLDPTTLAIVSSVIE